MAFKLDEFKSTLSIMAHFDVAFEGRDDPTDKYLFHSYLFKDGTLTLGYYVGDDVPDLGLVNAVVITHYRQTGEPAFKIRYHVFDGMDLNYVEGSWTADQKVMSIEYKGDVGDINVERVS